MRVTYFLLLTLSTEAKAPVVARGRLSAQRPKMEEAASVSARARAAGRLVCFSQLRQVFGQFASASVTMEIQHLADLTLDSVVERVPCRSIQHLGAWYLSRRN